MKNLCITMIVLACILTIGCQDRGEPTNLKSLDKDTFNIEAAKKIVLDKTLAFTNAHITRDTTLLNNIFTKDARVFAPNSEVVTGRTAISSMNSEWVSYGILEFTEESTAFYGNSDYLIDEGTYYLRYGDTVDKGKYINIWKSEKGEWKIYSNIWNTSLPIEGSE